ncbi:hypothetical protein [Thalassospira australica]|uniref:hypothetical protein n=1 Tax=Thalassospira australica TaxID=1528106 RepID=UPI00384A5841
MRIRSSACARNLSGAILAAGLASVAGCGNITTIEPPTYQVNDVQAFKIYGAPSQIMMLEIHDRQSSVLPETWASALSGHGFPPRLDFITDATRTGPNQTLRDGYRVVVAVSPSQTTMNEKICTAPETTDYPADATKVPVRIAFCAGEKPISQLRANFVKDDFEQQVMRNGASIIIQLFPRDIPDDNDRGCGMVRPGC